MTRPIEFWTVRGERRTRSQVLSLAALKWRGIVSRDELRAVLFDDAWCREYNGMIPTAVANEAAMEAICRRGRQ